MAYDITAKGPFQTGATQIVKNGRNPLIRIVARLADSNEPGCDSARTILSVTYRTANTIGRLAEDVFPVVLTHILIAESGNVNRVGHSLMFPDLEEFRKKLLAEFNGMIW